MLPNLKRILKSYSEAGTLHELVSVQAALDARTFVAKNGVLVSVLHTKGIDAQGLPAAEVEQITRRMASAHNALDESYRVFHYRVQQPFGSLARAVHTNSVVREAIETRTAFLEGRGLLRTENYIVVSYEGWRDAQRAARRRLQDLATRPLGTLRPVFSARNRIGALEGTLEQACAALASKVDRLASELGDVLKVEILDKKEGFKFLYGLLNPASHKQSTGELRYDQFVDYQLCDSALDCHRDHLRLDNHYLQVLTLKEPPARTRANLLKNLSALPSPFVAVTEWKRSDAGEMRRLIQSKQRHFWNSKTSPLTYVTGSNNAPNDQLVDQSASALVNNLGACLEEMELNDRYFGQFSLTIILYDEDAARLRRAVADCFKICSAVDITLTEERYNGLNAFLSILPGNDAFNVRRVWLTDQNYADLSLLFGPSLGERWNPALNTDCLAVMESNQRTPYFFNLHHDDVAHTLVLGATGSGKSFLLNFLITQLQQYAPYTFICDLGGSYESLTRLFGGTYAKINLEKPLFSINPFSLPLTAENHRFLLSFVRVLAETGDYRMSVQEERDVYEQIDNLYAVEPSQRRLLTLSGILGRPLREQLARWVQGGPYAALFDNVEDNLTFARFQTFDFEGMEKVPHLLQPLLFYILHRANDAIYDPALIATFKVFVVDEAWRLLRHPVIRAYMQEGLKTWRKKNAAMILATQSGDDLLASEMLPVVVESCPTKLFLANPGMDARVYGEMFHLNEAETSLIARLIPKQQILIKRPDRSTVVNLNVDPKGYWIYTNNPLDNQKKRDAFAQFGFERGLEELTRSHHD